MEEMGNKMEKILSDPESFSKIMSLASSVMESMKGAEKSDSGDEIGGQKSQEVQISAANEQDEQIVTGQPSEQKTEAVSVAENKAAGVNSVDSGKAIAAMLPTILSAFGGKSDTLSKSARERLNLLMAVKPFLHETHRGSIDRAASLVKAAQTAQTAMAGLTEGFNKPV